MLFQIMSKFQNKLKCERRLKEAKKSNPAWIPFIKDHIFKGYLHTFTTS